MTFLENIDGKNVERAYQALNRNLLSMTPDSERNKKLWNGCFVIPLTFAAKLSSLFVAPIEKIASSAIHIGSSVFVENGKEELVISKNCFFSAIDAAIGNTFKIAFSPVGIVCDEFKTCYSPSSFESSRAKSTLPGVIAVRKWEQIQNLINKKNIEVEDVDNQFMVNISQKINNFQLVSDKEQCRSVGIAEKYHWLYLKRQLEKLEITIEENDQSAITNYLELLFAGKEPNLRALHNFTITKFTLHEQLIKKKKAKKFDDLIKEFENLKKRSGDFKRKFETEWAKTSGTEDPSTIFNSKLSKKECALILYDIAKKYNIEIDDNVNEKLNNTSITNDDLKDTLGPIYKKLMLKVHPDKRDLLPQELQCKDVDEDSQKVNVLWGIITD